MKNKIVNLLVCPVCDSKIAVKLVTGESDGEIREGALYCINCKSEFPVQNYIARFVPPENYAHSFGFQWNKHARTQIDKFSSINMSRDRFFQVTKWNENLKGQKILEAGSGAGRFTQIAIETGAEVFSFDYSSAIDANLTNNGLRENLYLFQADIYRIPLPKNFFDKIFCFGVLQHCPNPKKAFMSLIPHLKEGGEISIDVYDFTFRAFVNPKYWLRPFAKHLSSERLYRIVEKVVPKLFPVKMWITEKVPFGKYFAFFIPVAYHKGFLPHADELTYGQLLEWSILDTFDKFAPCYDKPQRLSTVRKWFTEADLVKVHVDYGPNGIIGRGVKP